MHQMSEMTQFSSSTKNAFKPFVSRFLNLFFEFCKNILDFVILGQTL